MRVTDIKFFNRTINGASFSGNPSPYLHGNVGDLVKVISTCEIILNSISTDIEEFTLSGSDTLTRDSGSWLDDGFLSGYTFQMFSDYSTSPTYEFTGVVTYVDDLTLKFNLVTGTLANGGKSDHEVRIVNNLGGCLFRYGLIENNESTNFDSKINGRANEFYAKNISIGSPTQMLAQGKTGAHNSGSVTLLYSNNITGVHTVVIEHEFIITPTYLDEYAYELENGLIPSLFLNSNSLKYVFEVETRVDYNNPNGSKALAFDKLKGSVGWYDEELNGNSRAYDITSISYSDGTDSLDTLHIGKKTYVTINIETTNTFHADTQIELIHSICRSSNIYDTSLVSFEDTFFYDYLGKKGAGIVTGTNIIKKIDITYNTSTTATIVAEIEYSGNDIDEIDEDNEFYILSLSIADTTKSVSNTDKCSLLIGYEQFQTELDIPGLFTWDSAEIFAHPSDVTSYSNYRGWPQDGLKVGFTATIIDGSQLSGLRVGLMAYKSKTENFIISEYKVPFGVVPVDGDGKQLFNIENSRGFRLAGDDPFNEVVIQTTSVVSNTVIEGAVSIKIPWQDWIELAGADNVFSNVNLPNNGKNKLASNYDGLNGYDTYICLIAEVNNGGVDTEYVHLVDCDLFPYDEDDFTPPKWDVGIVYSDVNDNEFGLISTKEDTKITVTFTPESGTTSVYDGYVAIVRIQRADSTGEDIHELSSLRDTYTGNWLKPVEGETLLKLTDNSTELIAECLVDYTKLTPGVNYKVSARLFSSDDVDLTPIVEFDTSTYNGDGTHDIPLIVQDISTDPLDAGHQITVEVWEGVNKLETLSGLSGDDISDFTSNHTVPAKSIVNFASGVIEDAGTVVFDKLSWATTNDYLNADAVELTLKIKGKVGSYSSAFDSEVIEIETRTGYSGVGNIAKLDTNEFVFSDSAAGVRILFNDEYSLKAGSLSDCAWVSVDTTNEIIYAVDATTSKVYYWTTNEREDLGGTGVPLNINISSAVPSALTVYVNNDRVIGGYADVWFCFAGEIYLMSRNGAVWNIYPFGVPNAGTTPQPGASGFESHSLTVDDNGDIYVCGNTISLGFAIIRLSKTGGGSYTDITQWTYEWVVRPNTTFFTNGTGDVAGGEYPNGITIVGYDSTYGATSGTHPILIVSAPEDKVYREINHNGGVSGNEYENWTVSTPALNCGTIGVPTYSFGAGNIEVGSVYGACMDGTTFRGVGVAGSGVTEVIFKITNYGNGGTQASEQIFGGAAGSRDQIVF